MSINEGTSLLFHGVYPGSSATYSSTTYGSDVNSSSFAEKLDGLDEGTQNTIKEICPYISDRGVRETVRELFPGMLQFSEKLASLEKTEYAKYIKTAQSLLDINSKDFKAFVEFCDLLRDRMKEFQILIRNNKEALIEKCKGKTKNEATELAVPKKMVSEFQNLYDFACRFPIRGPCERYIAKTVAENNEELEIVVDSFVFTLVNEDRSMQGCIVM